MAWRAKVLFYVLFAIACALIGRYYVVQVRDGREFSERGHVERLRFHGVGALRGAILDRNGAVLVHSVPAQSVYANTPDVTDREREARTLAGIFPDMPYELILSRLALRHAYVQIHHKVARAQAAEIARLALPGIKLENENTGLRFDPQGRLASTVIGFTGTEDNGLAGLESEFDGLLRGSPGRAEREGMADDAGHAIPFAQLNMVVAARPGHSLVLTLDSYLQEETERVLRETVSKWQAESGSAIVMDPWTGEVLALANAPDYDVANFASYSADSWRDRAVMDAYEPGSVFKSITAAAALDSGKVTERDSFPARDRLQIGGYTINNAEDGFLAGTGSSETLGTIVELSHNVGAAEVGLRIGARTLYDAVRRFGFGDPTDIELPGESPGIVPKLADWSETTLPTVAFGQGISTTPIAIVRAYSAIANGGVLLRPRIVSAILDGDGRPVYRYGPEVERRAASPATAAILRRFLRNVVTNGTGNPGAQVAGYTTAGKTGTAQIAENGSYAPGAYVASFVGMIPAESPKYVILVKIERPRGSIYGGVVAAPAFAEIARLAMLHAGILPAGPRLVRAENVSKRSL